MAHKKAGGSSRNGRDSESKRLGVKAFGEQRGVDFNDIIITQKMDYDQFTNQVSSIDIHLDLPESFPAKYRNAIKKVVDQCPVKQHLVNVPSFNVITNLDVKVYA